MIQVTDLTFSHSGQPLYQAASFSLSKNKKAGLVGLNGAGKSTLFRLILGEEYPDDGRVRVEGSVALVPQEVINDPIQKQCQTVGAYLNHAKPSGDHLLLQMLSQMGLEQLAMSDVIEPLSGGQKTKLALLYALLKQPDILLLDEPTNFLDDAGKKWVMHFLGSYKKSLLIVSHDLELLDRHIHKVIYINKQTKKFEEYTGTYSQFKRLKADRDAHLTRYILNQKQHVDRLKKSVEKLKRSNVEKVIRARVQLERRITRIEDNLPTLPTELVRMKLTLPTPSHVGEVPLMVRDLRLAYGDMQVLSGTKFTIRRGQRVALIGRNGAGKSSLIKALMGEVPIESGSVEWDERVNIGYYSQGFEGFDFGMSVFDILRQETLAADNQIRSFLARFMFGQEAYRQQVGSLSGGEKTRLAIAMLMLRDHNFLILDEPTTYLDVMSQRIILEALKAYRGTMLVVSHTPDFLRELAPNYGLLLPEERYVFWDNSLLTRSSEM